MTSREFCYWLQGFFEIADGRDRVPGTQMHLTGTQLETIQRHLSLVFTHEIDPSYPNQEKLDAIHNPNKSGVVARC